MFELLFKYSRETFARSEFVLANDWPVVWLVVLSIVAVAAVGASLVRTRRGLSWPRTVALGAVQSALLIALLILVWRPALSTQTLRPQENAVAVMLDTSASMIYGEGERSRLQQAVAALEQRALPALAEQYPLKLHAFDEEAIELESFREVPAPGPRTRLGDSLLSVLRAAQSGTLGAVVLVSDGGDNSQALSASTIAEIASFGIPVHTVGVGRERIPEDVELADVVVSPRAVAGSAINAEVSIRHAGAPQAVLKVYDGDAIIASETIALPSRPGVTTRSIDLDVGDPGVRDLRFTLDALANERNLVNNTQWRPLEVPAERRHVLYIEGEPRWDYKFIRRALDEVPSLRLATLLRTTPNKFYRQGILTAEELEDGFPTDEETLFEYDAMIVGSWDAASLTPEQQQMIAEFVSRRGGGLLMLGSMRGLGDGDWGATAVADVLPVTISARDEPTFVRSNDGFAVHLTDEGQRAALTRLEADDEANRQAWAEMPRVESIQFVDGLKPGATTLLEFEVNRSREPLLVHQNYGLGTAYVLASGGTWWWQMLLHHEDMRHETFWRQLVQTLSAPALRAVTLSTDRSFYADETSIELRAEVRDASFNPATDATVEVSVAGAQGAAGEFTLAAVAGQPGLYTGVYDAPAPGLYRFTAVARSGDDELGSARVAVRRDDGIAEHFRVEQNRALLERIANVTGGRYFALADVDQLFEAVQFSEAGVVERRVLDLWNIPIVFMVLLLMKGGEWLLRLRWGRL